MEKPIHASTPPPATIEGHAEQVKQLGSDEGGDSEYQRRCQHRLGGVRHLLTARAIFLDLRKHCTTDRGVYQRQNRYDGLELLFHDTAGD